MKNSYLKLVSLIASLVILLSACGGGGGSSEESGNSDSGAPSSLIGYKLVMTIDEVEVVVYSPTVNLLSVGDTMTLQFIDEYTIYGESELNEIQHESWDYSTTSDGAKLNLYTAGGEVHFDFTFNDSYSGRFVYDGEIYSSGARTRYYGDFEIYALDGSGAVTGFATELQGKWLSACSYGVRHEFEFSGSEMHYTPRLYETEDCSGTPFYNEVDVSTDSVIGDQVITDNGLIAHEIDHTYTYVSESSWSSVGDQYYGLVFISGDNLYLEDNSTGSGASEYDRPTGLDLETPFARQ